MHVAELFAFIRYLLLIRIRSLVITIRISSFTTAKPTRGMSIGIVARSVASVAKLSAIVIHRDDQDASPFLRISHILRFYFAVYASQWWS